MNRTLFFLGLALLAIPLTHAQVNLRKSCPLKITPLTGIGPLTLSSTAESILKMFPDAKTIPLSGGVTAIDVGGLNMSFCAGKAAEIWVDFSELKNDCVEFQGHRLGAKIPLKRVRRWLGGCPGTETTKGGTYYNCGQGLKIGTSGASNSVTTIRLVTNERCNL